jgi:hypothetical protein
LRNKCLATPTGSPLLAENAAHQGVKLVNREKNVKNCIIAAYCVAFISHNVRFS